MAIWPVENESKNSREGLVKKLRGQGRRRDRGGEGGQGEGRGKHRSEYSVNQHTSQT